MIYIYFSFRYKQLNSLILHDIHIFLIGYKQLNSLILHDIHIFLIGYQQVEVEVEKSLILFQEVEMYQTQ